MKIVILGDCAINGNNSIGHLIFKDVNMSISFSIAYHIRKYNSVGYYLAFFKDATHWYLQNNIHKNTPGRNTREHIQNNSVKLFRDHIINNDLRNVVHTEQKLADWYKHETGLEYARESALQLVKKKELENHWSSMLTGHTVYNYALNGNTYGNYYLRIKKHIAEHGKPDLVIMSDHSDGHYFSYFKHNNKTYHAIMTYGFMEKIYNKNLGYSEYVFEKKKKIFQREIDKPQSYHDRKNQKYRRVLTKYLNLNDITYIDCFYHTRNLKFREKNSIDFTNISKEWRQPSNGAIIYGNHCISKLSTVAVELQIIKSMLPSKK